MQLLTSLTGTKVSYKTYGSGPPLVLIHGGFSDHQTNWEYVKPLFEKQFTVYAIARRGRGKTATTQGHSLVDESFDVVALIDAINEPVFLLGHSYGAQLALAAAAKIPERVRKLVLYEAPWPHTLGKDAMAGLEKLAETGHWEEFVIKFFHECLLIPLEELDELQTTAFWRPILADAQSSLGDMKALNQYDFNVENFHALPMPVLLQIGTASFRNLYITDALATVLPDVRIEALPGQAHEGMTTAPRMYAEAVSRFLLG
jgi:pimeloyl-ACP methyl ester carboxylesterase